MLVNFVTNEPEEEQLCIVQEGEHPFVTRETAVRYKDGRVTSVSQIELAIASGALLPREKLSEDLLRRVLAGAALSRFLPKKCKRVLEDQYLI